MDFIVNLLKGALLSLVGCTIVFFIIKDHIISKGNESSILKFYRKDIKSYKILEKFFERRDGIFQKPLGFIVVGALYLTFAYFIGLLVYNAFLYGNNEVAQMFDFEKSEIPDDREFIFIAYLIGLLLYLTRPVRMYLKSKELIEHYEKVK